MTKRLAFSLCALAALIVCSAVAVVYSKHLTRLSYAELSRSQKAIDELEIQWSQLQIEEGTFSEHGIVERTATERLGMKLPGLEGSVMIARHPN